MTFHYTCTLCRRPLNWYYRASQTRDTWPNYFWCSVQSFTLVNSQIIYVSENYIQTNLFTHPFIHNTHKDAPWWWGIECPLSTHSQGLYSLSGKSSYHQISWSLEDATLEVVIIVLLWIVTGTSAALLPTCLSNFRTIGKVYTRISPLRDLQ